MINLDHFGREKIRVCEYYPIFHIRLPLFSLQRLPHPERDAGFVECLVCGDGHADFVADAEEEETTFLATDCDLTNEFIYCGSVKIAFWWGDAKFFWGRGYRNIDCRVHDEQDISLFLLLDVFEAFGRVVPVVIVCVSGPIRSQVTCVFKSAIPTQYHTCRLITSNLVAGVLDTFCTHNCPVSSHSLQPQQTISIPINQSTNQWNP